MYIDDLRRVILENVEVAMFADDVSAITSIKKSLKQP